MPSPRLRGDNRGNAGDRATGGAQLAAEPHPAPTEVRIGRPLADVLVTSKMIDMTREVWTPMAGRELSREEAHGIIVDVSIFLRDLLRWDQVARKAGREEDGDLAQAA